MFRNLIAGLALSAAFALPLANTAEAAIGDGVAASHVASQLLPVEKAQFVWGGRQYCWYDNGWRGPGFYWCGYFDKITFPAPGPKSPIVRFAATTRAFALDADRPC